MIEGHRSSIYWMPSFVVWGDEARVLEFIKLPSEKLVGIRVEFRVSK
mgnify:CR=1 FL=1